MKNVTEQLILSLAPNPAAAANGKKISQSGGFQKLYRSADGTLYMGECKGSGKNPYITSADYIDPERPVFRCSCPSRQFPCKHSLGLLYEMMSGKPFEQCDIPEDIRRKRGKLAAKSAPEKSPGDMTPEELEKAEKKKASAAKTASAAKKKKLQKQLEGLDLAEKAVKELVSSGLGTMGGASLPTYRELSRQLGDYYLNGPQRLLNRLMLEITEFQKDNLEIHYDNAIDALEKLYALIKKSREYINAKIDGSAVNDDTVLYEELGGNWKLSELEALGKCKKNARLVQLSFWVTFDAARQEYIDTGAWCDFDDGNICLTKNFRPLKSLKYVKADDSTFGAADIPSMAVYPADFNPRVRWDGAAFREATPEDYAKIRSHAARSITEEAKAVKNALKNAMASPVYYKLISFAKIGKCESGAVLRSKSGDTVLLGDFPELEPTVERLELLPQRLTENGTMLCGLRYSAEKRRLCAQPLCVIPDGENTVIRLLY
ncbi:MAG: SWIM zinc finger family protein [Lachnospiraceae bacterium]|nr:SWIM zinc finger family protein [Ruminococcus sp.]MCM1274078.1 SWIM zinc finger family protein [Lachnospiraceae bacterium]